MSNHPKKMAVLLAVKNHDTVSLPELLEELGTGYAERSVRRWLQEWVLKGEVAVIGRKKSTRYFAPEKNTPAAPRVQEEAASYLAQPLYLRSPVSYRTDWVMSYEPNKTFYLTESQRAQLRKEGTRRYAHETAGTYARHIYNRLLIDLSYNSSRLEGNTYSLLETERLLLEGDANPTKLAQETVMILNHKEAIRFLVDNAGSLTINEESICTLHYLLLDGLLPPDQCGFIRHHGVKIGGSSYLPLDNRDKIENFIKIICRKAAEIIDPFEQSFFLLTQIAYLQAFEDGNKRTSRLSANIPLIRENFVPMSFNDIPKEDYLRAMLAVYELNTIEPLADLYIFSYSRTCKQYDISVESVGYNFIRIKYRQQRREVIKYIIEHLLNKSESLIFIEKKSEELIPEINREAFINVINEDIQSLSINQIMGLGISAQEFNKWLKNF